MITVPAVPAARWRFRRKGPTPFLRYGWQEAYICHPSTERYVFPLAGVYAVYREGRLVYIGSSRNLERRLSGHNVVRRTDTVKICYTRPRSYDHLSREARLIERLRPPLNKRYGR